MKALNTMVEAAMRGDFMAGFSLENHSDGALSTCHLLFAYDTIIFCNADSD